MSIKNLTLDQLIGKFYVLCLITFWLGHNFSFIKLMNENLYNNADSFAISFDQEWNNIDCEDLRLKVDKVFELLSDHPFMVSNPENARKLAEFRIFSLKKFQ